MRRGPLDRLPRASASQLRAGWPRHGDRLRRRHRPALHAGGRELLAGPPGADRPLPRRRDRGGRGCDRGLERRGADRRHHGAHRGSGRTLRRFELRASGDLACSPGDRRDPCLHREAGARAERDRPDERAVCSEGRHRLCARSESARFPHGAVCQQGHRRAAAQDRGRRNARQENLRFYGCDRRPQRPAVFREIARVSVQ